RQEILAGIRNALEKGESLEQAKASFINAGYGRRDVEEAAASILGFSEPTEEVPEATKISSTLTTAQMPQKKKSKYKILIIIIVIVLILLLASYFLKDKLIDLIKSLI
ncbi:MAG: hypothetical protein AABX71_03560, partial [Nanoarchaeota archaeon]